MEDTTFATFIVGALAGFLFWYWIRRATRSRGVDDDLLLHWLSIARRGRPVEIIVSVIASLFLLGLSIILLYGPWLPEWGYTLHKMTSREPVGTGSCRWCRGPHSVDIRH